MSMIVAVIIAAVALILTVIARLLLPGKHFAQIQLAETQTRCDALYHRSESMVLELEHLRREANQLEHEAQELDKAMKELERSLDDARLKPSVLVRETIVDATPGTQQFVALIDRQHDAGHAGIWEYLNHLVIYADTFDAARDAAGRIYPSSNGYSVKFVTETGEPLGKPPSGLAVGAPG